MIWIKFRTRRRPHIRKRTSQLVREAQNHAAPKGKPGIAWRQAANAVALRTLLLQEARARGIPAEPVEVGPGRFETEAEALIRGLLESAVHVAAPTEEAIRADGQRCRHRPARRGILIRPVPVAIGVDRRAWQPTGCARAIWLE